ncbi:MAG: metallophosphoesterase [Clostridiales bacterium]|nr:metallophosphoesterase [Clostridiales bacterium]
MALYAIGDPHLSLNSPKSMEVFGGNWVGYVDKLLAGFQCVAPEDTVVFCGDLSWGMSLEESLRDFAFLNALPGGRKILLKGNHDYWWTTASKMNRFFQEHGFRFELLHNNCLFYGDVALCGTRGWFLDEEKGGHNEKMLRREVIRLETSLQAAGDREKLVFLHYPPIYQGYRCPEILELLERYQVRQCYFAHLHGPSIRLAVEGWHNGTRFSLISADYLNFVPKRILEF